VTLAELRLALDMIPREYDSTEVVIEEEGCQVYIGQITLQHQHGATAGSVVVCLGGMANETPVTLFWPVLVNPH
jgi:hypothetical protein